jgi:hypothetical protein
VYLVLSFAVYRWGIPLRRPAGAELLVGLALAVPGSAIGHLLGVRATHRATDRATHRARRPHRVLAGVVAAAIGAVIAPATMESGADLGVDPRTFRPTAGAATVYTIPAAGRYAIYAEGRASADSGCRVTGNGMTARRPRPVPLQPGTPGFDGTPGYRWIAQFEVPAPGTYSLTCRPDGDPSPYSIGAVPRIDGMVGTLARHAPPRPVIWLFGALPGLLAVAAAVRKRARRRGRAT